MRARRLAGVVVAIAIGLSIGSPATAAPGDWADGEYQYRVASSGQVITMNCQGDACAVEPFTIDAAFAGDAVTTKTITVSGGFGMENLPALRTTPSCPPQGRVVTVAVRPGTSMNLEVSTGSVQTSQCSRPEERKPFVAEAISAPQEPAATEPAAAEPVAPSIQTSQATVLSNLRTVGDVTSFHIAAAVVGAVVLVILLVFPSSLLNSAVESAFSRAAARRRLKKGLPADEPAVADHRWWWAVSGVLAAGVISMFVEPSIGPNLTTLRMLGSFVTSFALEIIAGWALVLVLMRRWVPTAVASYSFKPASLLIVAALVAFSRLTEFQPGLVFGAVAGVTYVAVEAQRDKAFQVLVPTSYAFCVALLAWLGYSALGAQTDGVGLFVSETLAAAVAGGIAALPLILLPVHGLAGRSIYEWSPPTWAISYVLALSAFFIVLMPMPSSWSRVDVSLAAWLSGYAIYCILGLVAWLALRDRVVEADDPVAAVDA